MRPGPDGIRRTRSNRPRQERSSTLRGPGSRRDRNLSRATGVLDHAVRLHLHDTEPLLALEHAMALANQGKLEEAGQVAVLGLVGRTTDGGYDALDDWVHGPYEEHKRRATPRPRLLERVRSSRPIGRVRPNRYKW